MSTVSTRYSPQTNVAAGESGDSSDSEDSRDDNGKPRGQISLQNNFGSLALLLLNFTI